MVVLFCGSYLGSNKVFPKRNHNRAYGQLRLAPSIADVAIVPSPRLLEAMRSIRERERWNCPILQKQQKTPIPKTLNPKTLKRQTLKP